MIDNPPLQDLERIKSEGFQVAQGLSNRVIYLHMDQHGEETPGITGTDGKNPLLDKRVRKAISIAINREAIVERIMNGVAVPAGELLPQGFFGTTPRSEEHTSELQSLMRISYAVFCLKNTNTK